MVIAVASLALSGALFKALENDALVSSFEKAANRSLTSADKSEIRGLLSGSDAAVHKLATLAPQHWVDSTAPSNARSRPSGAVAARTSSLPCPAQPLLRGSTLLKW